MDLSNIVPVTIRDYNEGVHPRECVMRLAEPFNLARGSDYELVIRKIRLPINTWMMPIDVNTRGFQINFQYEDKDVPFKDLVYGPNVRTIEGRIYSVREFIQKLNDLFIFYELGSFTLDRDTELITFTSTTAAKWANIIVYMERKLCNLLGLHYEIDDTYTDERAVWMRFNYKFQINDAVPVTQEEYGLTRFYQIAGINVYSDLPSSSFTSDSKATQMRSGYVTNVDYNAQAMRFNDGVTSYPTTSLHRSITNPGVTNKLTLTFKYVYNDGQEIAVFLDVGASASVEANFEKIEKIIL